MICNYCGKEAEWVSNAEIYGKPYGKSFMIWLCRPCGAYVSCHNNTKNPLGSLADTELRGLRIKAHAVFDKLWRKEHGTMKRKEAYLWLKNQFGREIHIGESDKKTCSQIISLLISGGRKRFKA